MRQGIASIEEQLSKQVRAEYVRALINGDKAVINRAYIQNNPAISQDYAQVGPERNAFKALLKEGVIVPWLLAEQAPIDPPASGAGTTKGYETQAVITEWQRICQEVRTQCVRLSWDDGTNDELTRVLLSERFNKFVAAIAVGNSDTYIRDLGLDKSASDALTKRFVEVGQECLNVRGRGRLITRNDLYKAFVTAGDNPAERKYDNTKPFAAEIKQLIDLSYNCNLPDALRGYLLTPVDSLPRTALQEWQQRARQPEIIGEDLITLLQQLAFDLVMQAQSSEAYLASMGLLSLQDVREVRRTDEWAAYIHSMKRLLENPTQFASGGAQGVYQSYQALMEKVTKIRQTRKGKENLLAPWLPTLEVIINIAGATLSLMLTVGGPVYRFSTLAPAIATAPLVARLMIRGAPGGGTQADLDNSIDFMNYEMRDAIHQWRDMQLQMRANPTFREIEDPMGQLRLNDATINFQDAA